MECGRWIIASICFTCKIQKVCTPYRTTEKFAFASTRWHHTQEPPTSVDNPSSDVDSVPVDGNRHYLCGPATSLRVAGGISKTVFFRVPQMRKSPKVVRK